jgi:DNA (cytosine-5)-methyltransferase 1
MRYGSVCSGVEAATVAWHPLGWKPQWFSEIEAFPSAVLAHHYPDTPNHGDMTKFKEWNDDPIDLLVGGTPCQSFSVAGLRKGLDDPRGNLMLTYLAIAARYSPKWLVWENVPGVLSSNRGRDFGTFLGALGQLGYGFAYRVLDAQYFGVAQRRRRVFVVGYLGDWRRSAAVLFERESLSGHPAPSRKAREEVAACLTRGVGQRYELETETLPVTIGSLCARTGLSISTQDAAQGHLLPIAFDAYNNNVTGYVTKTIDTGQDYHHVPIAFSSNMSVPDCQTDGTTPTLKLGGHGGGNPPAVLQTLNIYGGNKRPDRPEGGFYVRTDEMTSKTLDAATGLNPTCSQGGTAVMQEMQVRRLTPRECERLQGFPDDYTLIPYRNKLAVDGPRYKAMGNSMAVPVMRWIGERIQMVEDMQ